MKVEDSTPKETTLKIPKARETIANLASLCRRQAISDTANNRIEKPAKHDLRNRSKGVSVTFLQTFPLA